MEQTKQRVAVYCRFSNDSEGSSYSCAAQAAYYTEMVGKNPDWELAGIYADQSIISADRKNRRDFNKMIAACEKGHVDIIITRSISRFARNLADCLEIIRKLKRYGVAVIFEKENVCTLDESSEVLRTLYGEFVRRECEAIAQRHEHPMIFPCRYGCIHVLG